MHATGLAILARLGFRNPSPPRLPSLPRPRRLSGLGAFAALALATLTGLNGFVAAPARAQSSPLNVIEGTSGTNPAVHVTLERVPITNPDYFRQNQYTAVPNLAPSAPGTWSVVSLGNSSGNQPVAGGPLAALNDGLAPASEAELAGSSVFSITGNYGLLYDLGSVRSVTSITTYSAGLVGNAVGQNYQIWGSNTLRDIYDNVDPDVTGWQRIASGAAHPYWGSTLLEGGAYGIHLTSNTGSGVLGNFRYILFGMQDTGTPGAQGAQAMISEISVQVAPTLVAEGDFQVSILDNTVTITRYVGLGGDVIIPARIGGLPVVAIGYGAFAGYEVITSVMVPPGVTLIGAYAFANCTVPEVVLPAGLKTIGEFAFSGTQLVTVVIPASVESIGDAAFDTRKVRYGLNWSDEIKLLQHVGFEGNAPLMGDNVFGSPDDYATRVSIFYQPGASGFTSPTWQGYVTSEIPTLAIAATDGGLLLSWPTSATGWVLETTTDLAAPDSWTPAEGDYLIGPNTRSVLIQPTTAPARFYRLRASVSPIPTPPFPFPIPNQQPMG